MVIGVLGAGRIGRLHAENVSRHMSRARLKSVCDPSLDERWARDLGVEICASTPEGIFDDPEIEAVVIATPSRFHVDLIERAAEAGKQIFCEKPVAFDVEAIQRAHTAATAAKVRLQVGFNRRFDPAFRHMKEAIEEGTIGDVDMIRIVNRDPRPPARKFIPSSGGLFFDFTIHDLDMVRFLSGSEIAEVHAAGAVLVDPGIGELGDIDTVLISLRLENGALATIDNSRQTGYGYDQRVEVLGAFGDLKVVNPYETLVQTRRAQGIHLGTYPDTFIERYREAYLQELRSFLRCVQEGTPVEVGAADASAAVLAAQAAQESHLTGRRVTLQPHDPGVVEGTRA